MSNWIRYTHHNLDAFGVTTGSGKVNVFEGDMFNNPTETGHCI